MDLIDNYNIQTQNPSQKFYENFVMAFRNCFKGLIMKYSINSQNKISLYCFLCQFQQQRILAELSFNHNCEISIECTLVNQLLLKCSTHEKRINIIRYFLSLNEKNEGFNFKIHPISGRLNLCIKYNMQEYSYLQSVKYAQSFFNYLNNLQTEIKNNFQFVALFLGKQISQPLQNQIYIQNKSLNKSLKTYINSSAHYAWIMVEGGTRFKKQQQNKYEQKKKKFRNYRKSYKNSKTNQTINQIYNESKIQNEPFFVLRVDEDEQLLKNKLEFHKCFNHSSKIINQITIDHEELKKIFSNKQAKINTLENGQISVVISSDKKQNLQTQRKILAQLPQQQFIGLPRYYIIKNFQSQTTQYRLTNLTNTLSFATFLENNKQTISRITQLSLIHKISNTLRYLRQNETLYHNLHPDNIQLKKGLITKLTDFSNSFCPQIEIESRKNVFPYVSNINTKPNKTYQEEKSDSYSLGVLMYYTLYQKNPFNIKASSIQNLSEQEVFQRLCNKPIIGMPQQKKLGFHEDKLLFKFILDAINHNFDLQKMKQFSDCHTLRSRPYLDWFTIITSEILNKRTQE